MAFLRITDGPARSDRPHKLESTPFVVGRANSCDLPIEDKLASRKHCRLVPGNGGGGWMLEDLGSRNGTLLNEKPLQAATSLRAGDRIRIGQVELTFDDSVQHAPHVPANEPQKQIATPMPETPSSAEPAFGAPGTVFELRFSGRCGTSTHILDGPVTTVGRSEEADIDINEPLASRIHCQFEVKATGIKVVDLESRNGTQVNGDTVNQKFLERTDRVQIGESIIEVASRLPLSTREMQHHAAATGSEGARPTASERDGIPAVKLPTPAPADRPVLTYTEDGEVRRFKVLADNVTIGRSEKAGLTLKEQLASREHVVVRLLPSGSYEVEDLGSRNGTRLNGRELRGKIELVHGDVIQIGAVSLRFDVPGQGPAPAPTVALGAAAYGPGGGAPGTGRVGSGAHPAAGVPEVGGRRRRRRRGAGGDGGDGNLGLIVGGVVAMVAVLAIVMVIVNSGTSRSSNTDDDDGYPRNSPIVRTTNSNTGSNTGSNVNINSGGNTNQGTPPRNTSSNGSGTTPVNNNGSTPPRNSNTGGTNNPPADDEDAWSNAPGISALERESRVAWVECHREVERLLDVEHYGEALQMLKSFLRKWDGQPRSEAATARAAAAVDKVTKEAKATWRNFYVPKIEALPPAERADKFGAEILEKFGGIPSIELEARDLGVMK
ncbi:MAG: FHA domain-containing protein [Planctomycetota bacterium]